MPEYIVIPNWERFQHYGDRSPPWIKLYTDLAHRDEWFQLSAASRGLLVSCWVEYALSSSILELAQFRRRSGLRARPEDLEPLIQAGFLQISASKPSRARADAPSREERASPLREEKNARAKRNKSKPHTTGWRMVRGSHGITYVPDREGIDRPNL